MALAIARPIVIVAVVLVALAATSVVKWATPADPSTTFHVVIAPGEDPAVVPIDVTAAPIIEIDPDGALIVRRESIVQRFLRPRAYQAIDGVRRPVDVRFEITPAGQIQFAVGVYDHSRPLYITSTK